MAWRTVFLVEYAGPILAHAAFYWLRPHIALPYVYVDTAATPPTDVQTLLFGCFMAHFVKRELETAFLHKFAANTMPAANIVRNSAFYWVLAGLMSAFSIYATWSPFRYPMAARSGLGPLDYVGLALFAAGELCNFAVHRHLAALRSRGGTEKGIPSCIGSSLVTAPNYMFEVLAWLGVILISRDLWVVVFIAGGTYYMAGWGRDKELDLRRRFPDKYKKKRYVMLPGLI